MLLIHEHVDVLATVMLVAVAPTSTRSVTAYTTLRDQTVNGVCPCSTTSHGDTVPPPTPTLASLVTATTTQPAAITMPLSTRSPIAMTSEEGAFVMTVRTTQVRN